MYFDDNTPFDILWTTSQDTFRACITFGNLIDKFFPDTLADLKMTVWETAVDMGAKFYNEWFDYFGDKQLAYDEVNECILKVKKYKPDFKKYLTSPVPDPVPIQPPPKRSGCYIATAVYGSYDCPSVWTLRRFRDYYLSRTLWGRFFIKAYYATSPTLVKYTGHSVFFKNILKPILDNLVNNLKRHGYKDTPYND